MSYTERDYIKRIIERLGVLVASLLGLRAKGRVDEALARVTAEGDALLPVPLDVLDAVDVPGALLLLREPAHRRAYADLCALRAVLLQGLPGREAESNRWRVRAGQVDSEAPKRIDDAAHGGATPIA